MSIGSMAKKMLGYADEFIEGASKGIGDGPVIKNSVNRIKSNMTKGQKKALANFGKSKGTGAAAANTVRGQQFVKGNAKRLNTMASQYAQQGDTASEQLTKKLSQKKGIISSPTLGSDISNRRQIGNMFGNKDIVSGIQNPTFANKAGDFFAGGARDTMAAMKNGQGFGQALKTAHTDASGKLRYDRVAGSFMTASAAARIATGGGLYKDRNGSTNTIGVPFI